MVYNNACWISPDFDILDNGIESHIAMVIKHPEYFGITAHEIEACYKKHGERLRVEGKVEVLLYCHESPLIYARTIIPAQTLTGEQRELGELGDRPLGEFLFSQPGLKRDVMEVAALRQGHQLFDSASAHISVKAQEIWARRSVFRLEHKPLLVAEVFLPELLNGHQ